MRRTFIAHRAPAGKPAEPRPAAVGQKTAGTTGPAPPPAKVPEVGGPQGPEPTRFGDWERNGRCIDF
jgi:hypothetical protein